MGNDWDDHVPNLHPSFGRMTFRGRRSPIGLLLIGTFTCATRLCRLQVFIGSNQFVFIPSRQNEVPGIDDVFSAVSLEDRGSVFGEGMKGAERMYLTLSVFEMLHQLGSDVANTITLPGSAIHDSFLFECLGVCELLPLSDGIQRLRVIGEAV
jgi:hypothetical protein